MRVYTTKKARKQYRCNKCGKTIQIGESFRYWQHMHSPVTRRCISCGFPKPSELATGDKSQRYLAAGESVEEAAGKVDGATLDDIEQVLSDLISVMQEAAEEVRSVGEEYGEAADNMESAFPNGSSTIDDLRSKSETCETWADSLESAVSTLEDLDVTDLSCGECDGSGKIACPGCDGSGTVECSACSGDQEVDCDECSGTGDRLDEIKQEIASAVEDAMSEALS